MWREPEGGRIPTAGKTGRALRTPDTPLDRHMPTKGQPRSRRTRRAAELSTQSSVPSDTSGAVKRPPKTTARTLHSPVGVGSAPPRRDYYAGAGAGVGVTGRQGPGPAAEGGRMHIQAHMPPAVREELRDRDAVSQSQSSMSSFWYSANPRGVPGVGSGAGTGVGGSTAASLDLGPTSPTHPMRPRARPRQGALPWKGGVEVSQPWLGQLPGPQRLR